MATAQYETRTRTVEETVVVLELTEDEAAGLRGVLESLDYTGNLTSLLKALQGPEVPTPTDTYTYDGVVYDLSAQYRDVEGDIWEFSTELSGPDTLDHMNDGTPLARFRTGSSGFGRHWTFSLAEVTRNYGPLTKVTE
ncbi:phiSA1p31-related protein [Streptomyces sp. DH12]|uniref:phiSA1p31-related protein n=1 Tax=Streptomyces sp. DH12 TaxID=2857010 RepID=UPI001E5EC55F|nr:phiSA1p31-related protein [Streptomyces sp. DH12]